MPQIKVTTAQLEELAKIPDIQIVGVEFDLASDDFVPLVQSSIWPAAVPPGLIVGNDTQKKSRARSIVRSYLPDLTGKKFLDFGCGEGHTIPVAAENTKLAVGYDIKKQGWDEIEQSESAYLTTDLEKVKAAGPFDVILLYDVLDHAKDRFQMLKDLDAIAGDTTLIKARCHPFTSRHGTHVYPELNKAFVHLFLTPDQLKELGATPEWTWKNIRPMKGYKRTFAKAGFEIVNHAQSTTEVEEFFKTRRLFQQFMKIWAHDDYVKNNPKNLYEQILPVTFIDFTLKANKNPIPMDE